MSLQEVLKQALQLSTVDKVRLIQQIAPEIERELIDNPPTPRKLLWGLCADLGQAPSESEIDVARSEEWANFSREDI
ncbi:hypothetical protein [Brasilonema bromeliae]|uniref:Plasmid stability protein n=1 Tax=Brasilonema bromeliae SPC951 TaxID=385972 RepID=A0ABX1P582_9CYAN|nr:hypothetical protein [Brasilonema bromeliae]NMG19509.1 hypothetical protein [Brasilonema bromeliae SPC951]